MHNHNTCTDGSVSAGYAIDRAVGTGTAAAAARISTSTGSLWKPRRLGNRDCRFSDSSANIPATHDLWTATLGQTIDGITITKLEGTQPATRRTCGAGSRETGRISDRRRSRPAVSQGVGRGLEWVVPGHEHTDVAVIAGQHPHHGNAAMRTTWPSFEFRFDVGTTMQSVRLTAATCRSGRARTTSTTAARPATRRRFPVFNGCNPTSAAVVRDPTHSERAGPFNPAGSNGYNIEHFATSTRRADRGIRHRVAGHFAQGSISGGSGSYTPNAVGGGTYGLEGVYTARSRAVGRTAR